MRLLVPSPQDAVWTKASATYGHAGYMRLTEELAAMNFKPSAAEAGLHTADKKAAMVYVDDILIAAQTQLDVMRVKEDLTLMAGSMLTT